MLKHALAYAARGWAIFPIHGIEDGVCTCGTTDCPDIGKHPVTRSGHKDASKDPDIIKLWWKVKPYNIGIATGEKSGVTVLDIDIADGKPGAQTWAELIKEHGEPNTLICQTGSGGMHVYFTYNSVLTSSTNTLGPGIDCRNDGGYAILPPSNHKSGKKYEWLNDALVTPLPAHLAKRPDKKKAEKKRKKYSIDDVRKMLEFVPADDRDIWRAVGIILGREFLRSEDAWDLYVEWADKWGGEKGRNHDDIMQQAFHEISQEEGDLSIGTIYMHAINGGWSPDRGELPVEDFLYIADTNSFLYRVTGREWPGASADAMIGQINREGELWKASDWIKKHAAITSVTNDPDIENEVTRGFDCLDGHLVKSHGILLNKYRKPEPGPGDPEKAKPWLDHVKNLFDQPGDADQFIDYMSHRAQKPGEKPRFALVIAGDQGVGKDTAIHMCSNAIGGWNIVSIAPEEIDSGFNEFAAKVLVIVSEVASTQEMSKWVFNEKMKVLIAGTPDFMMVNPKYGHKYSVRLHCGVIITTNHISGLYIPSDDRRYDVIKCKAAHELGLTTPEERNKYFNPLWAWYKSDNGGDHVAAFLMKRDLSKWEAASSQRLTRAHREMVSYGLEPDQWMADILAKLGSPAVVTYLQIVSLAENEGMTRKEVQARLGYIMQRLGYSKLVNPKDGLGRWSLNGSGHTSVYFDPRKITQDNAVEFVRGSEFKKSGGEVF